MKVDPRPDHERWCRAYMLWNPSTDCDCSRGGLEERTDSNGKVWGLSTPAAREAAAECEVCERADGHHPSCPVLDGERRAGLDDAV